MSRLLVLDFDGTITDAEVEGTPFRQGYLEDVAVLAGLPVDEALAMAERFEADVAREPNRHGWVYDGHIVAPATVDPYLRIMPVARRIFDERGVFEAEPDRSRLLDTILYKYNYQKTNTEFRPGALDVLTSLRKLDTWVVTNSYTEPVQRKIEMLGGDSGQLGWLVGRVHGRAKKYVVDDSFDTVPTTLEIPGLERPILLRRPHYHTVLTGLLEKSGSTWSDLTVVGDIFELDLALPLALGARIGLVINEFTPDYERNFVSAHERGNIIENLAQIPELMAH